MCFAFYKTTDQVELVMDIYYPSTPKPGDRFPVVVIPFGYPDPESRIRRYGPVTSWAKLIAAAGMAAVIYVPIFLIFFATAQDVPERFFSAATPSAKAMTTAMICESTSSAV